MTSVSHKAGPTQDRQAQLRLAVSACLLGQKVRYDGGDKRHRFISQTLARWVQLIPVCPEVEIGMGVPRPSIHLVDTDGGLRAIGVQDGALDVTRELEGLAKDRAQQLQDVDGYIFKARSPSCGLTTTPIRRQQGGWRKGAGLYAARLRQALPLLPLVEEAALDAAEQRINFIQRMEAYARWRAFAGQGPGRLQLQAFHQSERLSLLAHGARGLRRMEGWLSSLRGGLSVAELHEYARQYLHQFAHRATRRRHARVLRHAISSCIPGLDRDSQQRFRGMIQDFEHEELELAPMLAQLRRLDSAGALRGQSYLQPSLAFRLRLDRSLDV